MAKRRPTYLQDTLYPPLPTRKIIQECSRALQRQRKGEGLGRLGDMGNLVDLEAAMVDVKVTHNHPNCERCQRRRISSHCAKLWKTPTSRSALFHDWIHRAKPSSSTLPDSSIAS